MLPAMLAIQSDDEAAMINDLESLLMYLRMDYLVDAVDSVCEYAAKVTGSSWCRRYQVCQCPPHDLSRV